MTIQKFTTFKMVSMMPFDSKGMNKTILLEKAYNEDDK